MSMVTDRDISMTTEEFTRRLHCASVACDNAITTLWLWSSIVVLHWSVCADNILCERL